MTDSVFQVPFGDLPDALAVFPLAGTMLLPGQQLPLNIFEPRYLAMVLDALKTERLIGMVQPRAVDTSRGGLGAPGAEATGLYEIGCAGRISTFQEAEGGRLIIILSGVCRFRIERELQMCNGYRRVQPDWSEFVRDMLDEAPFDAALETLRAPLEAYATSNQIDLPWDSLETLSLGTVVDLVSMQFPFDAQLKQALLEAPDQPQRLDVLRAALVMDAPDMQTTARH